MISLSLGYHEPCQGDLFSFSLCWSFRHRLRGDSHDLSKPILQSIEECEAIKEKVKRYIIERNAHEGAAGSGFGDIEAPPTPIAEVPVGESTGAVGQDAAQDVVDN